uniref:Conserved plasma membrane protein n=1 Tax=Steinernema glaseri TaxID=37863 RepID=A0A1I7YQM7_9BILA
MRWSLLLAAFTIAFSVRSQEVGTNGAAMLPFPLVKGKLTDRSEFARVVIFGGGFRVSIEGNLQKCLGKEGLINVHYKASDLTIVTVAFTMASKNESQNPREKATIDFDFLVSSGVVSTNAHRIGRRTPMLVWQGRDRHDKHDVKAVSVRIGYQSPVLEQCALNASLFGAHLYSQDPPADLQVQIEEWKRLAQAHMGGPQRRVVVGVILAAIMIGLTILYMYLTMMMFRRTACFRNLDNKTKQKPEKMKKTKNILKA